MDYSMLSHFPSDDYTAAANRAVATYKKQPKKKSVFGCLNPFCKTDNADDTEADNTGTYQGSERERVRSRRIP